MDDVNENVDVIVYEGKTIKVSEFPSLLAQQVSLINDNSENIVKAKAKAEKAKAAAEKAKNAKVKWLNKKASIEALQEALPPIIDALDSQTEIADSLSNSIRAISDATKFLFVLGVSNMAANRMVIRELELKLRNASKEQLSALAQQELQNILNQLKAQEHTFARLDAIETKVKSINSAYQTLENRIKAQEDNQGDNNIRLDSIESKSQSLEESSDSLKSTVQSLSSSLEQHSKSIENAKKSTIFSKTISLIAITTAVLAILFIFLR